MSNKTSDKNVANVTKKDIDILNALIYVYEARLPNYNELMDSEVSAIKNILSDYTRQKQINEEHKKINGELRERVKELEEENTLQRRQLNSAFDNGYIHTDKIRKLIASETINISGFECIALEDLQELLGGEIHENRT